MKGATWVQNSKRWEWSEPLCGCSSVSCSGSDVTILKWLTPPIPSQSLVCTLAAFVQQPCLKLESWKCSKTQHVLRKERAKQCQHFWSSTKGRNLQLASSRCLIVTSRRHQLFIDVNALICNKIISAFFCCCLQTARRFHIPAAQRDVLSIRWASRYQRSCSNWNLLNWLYGLITITATIFSSSQHAATHPGARLFTACSLKFPIAHSLTALQYNSVRSPFSVHLQISSHLWISK